MKKINVFLMSAIALVAIIVFSAFANRNTVEPETKKMDEIITASDDQLMANLFVTHGHCSSPFTGKVENLSVTVPMRIDGGNPLEELQLSFEINPESFRTCRDEVITGRVKTEGVFINKNKDNITFKSTDVYTMGLDWYQINGKLSIKGEESDVKFSVSGIRDPKESAPTMLVLEGQLDLTDWGIDYDLIVNGESNEHPTKWMHINMKIDFPQGC
ncbi:MAG: YceI family protein [Crocinitomicaceae bacterium]|nr:YceI family protein [Crocinitomicaceae bacterium]